MLISGLSLKTESMPVQHIWVLNTIFRASLVAQSIKNLPVMQETTCNAGDLGLIPGLGRSYGEGKGNSLKYSCLENSMDRGTWWATVQRVIRVGHYLTIKQTQYLIPCLTYFFAYLVIIPLFLVTHFQYFSAIGWPNASGICPLLSQGVHCD